MITELRIRNFKSWADTGAMRLAPITGLFGANSSGKTSILQFLLMLKQTVEATDRSRVLHFGDERTLVDLGTFQDVTYGHRVETTLGFDLRWKPSKLELLVPDLEVGSRVSSFPGTELRLAAAVRQLKPDGRVVTEYFFYHFAGNVYGMRRHSERDVYEYVEFTGSVKQQTMPGFEWSFPSPLRFYGFPQGSYSSEKGELLFGIVLALEQLFDGVFYLGPLREYPHRSYLWGGERPRDVGPRGEMAVHALMTSLSEGVVERVAQWLKAMGLIHSFSLQPIAPNRKEYEVKVKRNADSAEVLLTDVGFGVSQILPVLTLCYYVPENSILLLEQPEIHLHPSVQAALADVIIDVVKTRNLQIILESHSEHLLRRLQRRIAEESLAADQAALYFCEMADGASRLTPLQLDAYGNISNWPQDFFGDEMGELTAMTTAAMQRQQAGNGAG